MKLPVSDSSISMQNTSILIKVDLQNTKSIGFQLTILEKLDGGKKHFIYQPPFPGHSRQSHHRPLFAMNWSRVVINRPKTVFYIDETSTNCAT